MQLYGNNFSTNSNKVRFTANLMGAPYEFKTVNLEAGEQRSFEFLKISPAGHVPVLVDGDYVIFESNSIMRYLALKCGSSLYPWDIRKRCRVDQWIDFGSLHVGLAMGKIFYNTVVYKLIHAPKDENALQEGRKSLKRYLEVIESQLEKGPDICGAEISLADINILAALDPAEVVGFDLSIFPKITAWRKKLQSQPFYQNVYPSFTEYLTSKVPKHELGLA